MKDITTKTDIVFMVDTFYTSVRKDELLGPIFSNAIGEHWETHLHTMYNFWQTVLLHEHAYKGSPFSPHRKLPIQKYHFDRWLLLFNTTIDENFTGKNAEDAKWRASKMALMFQHKLRNTNL